jgi:hypothetical protein
VIGDKCETMTFKEKMEMAESEIGSQEFSLKDGVTGLGRRKLMRKESKGLPVATSLLLENSTNMGVRSICGKGRIAEG